MAADVAGVTTFSKATMETMRSGEVMEATVKFTTLGGLLVWRGTVATEARGSAEITEGTIAVKFKKGCDSAFRQLNMRQWVCV